jgi:hypothetical protein
LTPVGPLLGFFDEGNSADAKPQVRCVDDRRGGLRGASGQFPPCRDPLGERFALRYRGTTGSGGVTATFEGPLRRVVGRVLDGYDYVIETRGDGLEVVVLGAASSHAVPAPVFMPPTFPAQNVRRTD